MNKKIKLRKKGFILILTLWVLIIVLLIGLSFARRVQIQTKITKYHIDSMDARGYIIAIFNQICSEIVQDTDNEYDAYSEPWGREHSLWKDGLIIDSDGKPLNPQQIQAKGWVVDEEGKININTMDKSFILGVLSSKEFKFENINDVAEQIENWRLGVGKGFYIQDKGFSGGKGKPYSTVNEILWFPGITNKEMFGEDVNANSRLDPNEDDGDKSYPSDDGDGTLSRGLIDYFTIYSDGKININTAPKAVLLTLPMMTEMKVDELIRQRAGPDDIEGTDDDLPFTKTEELMDLHSISDVPEVEYNQMLPYITVQSNVFTIIAECTNEKTNLTKRITAVVKREKENLKCLSWKEE